MTMVAALAVISTQNSTVSGLSNICQGMAKMNMMPQFFAKTNKRKVPFFGVIFVSLTILIFAFISDSSSSAISFLILVGSVFWMISYILEKECQMHRVPLKFHSVKFCRLSGF